MADGTDTTTDTQTVPQYSNPGITDTQTVPQGPASTPASTSGSSPSILSDLGTLGSSALQFLGSPAGGQIVTGGLGMYQAGQANKQIQSLYSPVQTTGGQFAQAGQQTLAKTQPALTASIPGQTGFATEQQGVAATYGTGNLTTAQNAQLQQMVTAAKSRAMSELAAAGINDPNSSQAQAKMQEIDNNAMIQAQQMVTANQNIATSAENNVQSIYNTLLKQALDAAGLGTDAQLAAAQGIIKGDQQIGTALQTLLKGISGLTTTAQPTAGQPGQTGGGVAQAGGGTNVATQALKTGYGAVTDLLSKAGIGGGGPVSQSDLTGYSTDVSNQLAGMSTAMPAGSLVEPGATDTGAVMTSSATDFSGFDLTTALGGIPGFDTSSAVVPYADTSRT